MINSFLKRSFRTLWRNKAFSLLNILGLAIGIGASLLIFLVIRNEMSYDGYQSKRDRIFRMVTISRSRSNGEIAWTHSLAPAPLPNALRRHFPSLEKVAVMESVGGAQIYIPGKNGTDEKRFKESDGISFAEPALFDIFDFNWVAGNAKGMEEPNTAVISQSVARNYFGDYANAVGRTIQLWSYRVPLRIVGVFKDLPENTDVPIRIAASFATYQHLDNGARLKAEETDWRSLSGGAQCFVLLSRGHDIQKLQARLPAFVKQNYREDENKTAHVSSLLFQPLREVHLDKRFGTLKGDSLSTGQLSALALIGVFLLLVACINFINLATAQSVNRSRETGVRKALGSSRTQLVKQYLGETALLTFIALIIGGILAWMTVPYLCRLMEKKLVLDLLHYPSIIIYLLLTGIVLTLLAGFYPAMVLSGFNPIAAIKSKVSTRTVGGISLRRGLVVFQFMIAQLLVIGTLVVLKQLQFFRSQPLGFEKEAVVLLDLPSDSSLKTKYNYLKTQLQQLPGVAAASLCSSEPSSGGGWYRDFSFDHHSDKQPYSIKMLYADSGYFNTFRMSLAAGRLPYPSDTARELLVNETLVRKLGLKSAAEILGKTIHFTEGETLPVVGVLKDYNNTPLQESIHPAAITSGYSRYGELVLRLRPEAISSTLKQVQKIFTEVYPTYIYDCTFFDETIARFYKTEMQTAQLFKMFAILSICISCLGLYGLVSFMAVQKTKEVGIRKVLGASVLQIVYLFSKEFTILVGIAFLIAAPAGYYFMQQWLAGFHYHTQMTPGIFVLAIVLSITIAWLTVGYKAVKAALVNPVKSLKAE
ncbi:ABC transporter permease [uncultured Chitinophaga sp.]|jgi:ABC-type antimicrobial peptide transport system, permease component|uniref:ABC transporter permease n=1 Tax=uncultured Chitinophaga sp. TaxID=339340 RepID=UPI00262CDE03|nr:ABC transporter permease [uncultured Chitinophaga sp.]